MKILLLTDKMDTGGAETHVVELARGLHLAGHEVAVLSGGGTCADLLEREGIPQYRVSLPTHDPFRLLAIRKTVKRLVRLHGYEILHAHARLPALLLRGHWRGIGRVVTVHASFRCDRLRFRLSYWGERTVAVSEDLRTYLMERYAIPPERISVIPNGIDCVRFSPPPSDALTQASASRILFASRLDEDCSLGAELLCELAPTLVSFDPRVRITVLGGGNAFARIAQRAAAVNQALGIPLIRVLGHQSDMPSLLRAHSIFVGVSRAALEAAACGLAVILCGNEGYLGILDRDSLPQASLTNFCARGCEKPTLSRLREDVLRLLDSPDLCRALGSFGRACVLSVFDATSMCRRTEALYRACLPRKHPYRITVGGYFGCGNVGDDAIVQGLLHALSSYDPAPCVTVLSGSPARDRKRYGVRCVSRRNPFSLLRAILSSKALLFGGGSLLQNLSSDRSLSYYLFLLGLAQRLRRRTMLFGMGIGPLLGDSACVRVKQTLSWCDHIGLRDRDSLRLLSAIGIDPALLWEGADAAFLLPMPSRERGWKLLRALSVPPEGRCLCLVLRGERNALPLLPLLIAAARILCDRHALYPIILVMDRRHDLRVSRMAKVALHGALLLPDEPLDVPAILGHCECLLTMRLHAMIFSAIAKTPAIGIPSDARDNKLPSFARSAAMDTISPDQLSVPSLVERLEELLQNRDSLIPHLTLAVEEMRKKATKDLANIMEMIYNNK